MALLTIEQARSQCRVVGTHHDDDLEACVAGAEAAAAAYLNRALFKDQETLDAALGEAPAAVTQAAQEYADTVEAAKDVDDERQRAAMIEVAERRLADAELGFRRTLNGIVANPAILAAVRMLVGHFFENREDVVTGTIATQLPMSSRDLLRPYRLGMMP